jgi:hypothetical protein
MLLIYMVNFMVNDIHASCRGDRLDLRGYWEEALTAVACMLEQFNCRNVFMELKVYVRCYSRGWMTFVMNCVNCIVNDSSSIVVMYLWS